MQYYSRVGQTFQISSMSRLRRELYHLRKLRSGSVQVFRAILSLLLRNSHFRTPVLQSTTLRHLTTFRHICPFFQRATTQAAFHFHLSCERRCYNRTATETTCESHLGRRHYFLLFTTSNRYRATPTRKARDRPETLRSLSTLERTYQ